MAKLSYVYHCQDNDGRLIFRYDNAAHRPMLPYSCHKHLATGEVIEAEPPELAYRDRRNLGATLPLLTTMLQVGRIKKDHA